MSRSLKELYHQLILDRRHNPIGFKKPDGADLVIEAYNPVCGDKFTLYLDVRDNVISRAHYYGYGCALSKAATSLLIESLPGISLEQCQKLIGSYLRKMKGGTKDADELINALSMARKFPGREQCVVLSWQALLNFLEAPGN